MSVHSDINTRDVVRLSSFEKLKITRLVAHVLFYVLLMSHNTPRAHIAVYNRFIVLGYLLKVHFHLL